MLMIVEQRYNSSDPESLSQLERIVRRDRNHPSVILWSLGNEEPHQAHRARRADQRANSPRTSNASTRHGRRPSPWTRAGTRASAASSTCSASITAPTRSRPITTRHPEQPVYRLGDREHGRDARRICQRRRSATSSAPTTPSIRGGQRPRRNGGPSSPTARTSPAASSGPASIIAASRRPSLAPSISSQFGILDTCGFPKDDYYYYRAWWRPDRAARAPAAALELAGQGRAADRSRAHSNTEEVELLLNGKSLGRKADAAQPALEWRVPYAPGRLEAVGYNGGQVAARDVRETTGPAHAVELIADRRAARHRRRSDPQRVRGGQPWPT